MQMSKPPTPPQWMNRVAPREVLSVRLVPGMRQALDAYHAELQAAGWVNIQKHHIMEHLMNRLLTEAGRAELTAELADKHPG